MRIALCVPAYYPAVDYGGPIRKVKALADGLLDRGHHVEVWCADFGEHRARVPSGVSTVENVHVQYLRRIGAYRWTPIVPGAFRTARRAAVDVIHCFGIRDGINLPASWGARMQSTPYFVEPLGMLAPRLRKVALKRLVNGVSSRSYITHAAGVIVNSTIEANEVNRLVRNVTVTIRPNPLVLPDAADLERDTVRKELGVDPDQLLCIAVTRLSVTKGLDLLAAAVATTRNVVAVIVGPDDRDGAASVLRATVDRLGVGNRVKVMGPRYGADLHRLLASADVFVMPSLTESFGNAACEAAALGLPVIVTDACGIAELVADLEFGAVVPASVDGIVAGLSALNDPERRAHFARNAPRIRDVVAPSRVAALQESIYHTALG